MNKIPILQVYTEVSTKTGKPIVNWEFQNGTKAWNMVGILETIKKELLDTIDEQSWEEEGKHE